MNWRARLRHVACSQRVVLKWNNTKIISTHQDRIKSCCVNKLEINFVIILAFNGKRKKKLVVIDVCVDLEKALKVLKKNKKRVKWLKIWLKTLSKIGSGKWRTEAGRSIKSNYSEIIWKSGSVRKIVRKCWKLSRIEKCVCLGHDGIKIADLR